MASASSTYSLRTRGRSRHAIDKTPLTPSDTDHSLSSYAASDSGSIGKEEEGPGKGAEGKEVEFVDPFPDFLWMTTEEPHRSRRMAILKAHPEVRKLMGPTPLTFPLVLLVLSTQLCLSYLLRHSRPFSPLFLLTAYALGGTLNQNTFLAIHEITHNLAFRSIRANKFLAIIANFAIGVPYAMAFKGYHIEHHKFLGEDGIDTDLPSRLEAVILNNVAGKTFFATFQLLFYAFRPGFIRSQQPTIWHAINLFAVLVFDAILVHFWGWNALIYLLFSSFFAGSLHPCAAHFIAEHYLMSEVDSGTPQALAQETTSYYGWLNILCYNVGYHNEHHDFPSIPWTRLPELRSIAKEFYEPLPSHTSWPYVTYKFISDPKVGMWSRAKRTCRGEKLDERVWTRMASGAREAQSEGGMSDGVTSDEDAVGRGMEEAVLRGYGSDHE